MKTSHLIINDENLIIVPYQGKIFRRFKNGIVKKVGTDDGQGYLKFYLNGRLVRCHRFIFEKFYNTKLQASDIIDHINRQRDMNCIDNLRLVSHQQNCQNRTAHKTNKLNLKNIHFYERDRIYTVGVMINGKRKCYYFKNIEDAIQKRDEVYLELNTLGHCFSC